MVYNKNIEIMGPLHKDLKVIAAQKGISLKNYVNKVLQEAVNREND